MRVSEPRTLAGGQSVVEFALVLPIMLMLLLAVVDLGRIYTTMLSVESAAREAADFGAFGSQQWQPAVRTHTEAEMEKRACVAASNLPDYAGPDTDCLNPSFSYTLNPDDRCDDPDRDPPCDVTVTLRYDFRLLVPFNIELFGVPVGVPPVLTFERSSTFAMTDLELP